MIYVWRRVYMRVYNVHIHTCVRKRSICAIQMGWCILSAERISARDSNEYIKKKKNEKQKNTYKNIYSKPYYYRVLAPGTNVAGGRGAEGCSEDARACVYILYIFIFDSSGCVHFSHTSYVSFVNGTRYMYVHECSCIYIIYIWWSEDDGRGKGISVKFKNQIQDAEIIR